MSRPWTPILPASLPPEVTAELRELPGPEAVRRLSEVVSRPPTPETQALAARANEAIRRLAEEEAKKKP